MVIDTDSPPANPMEDFEDFFRSFEEKPNEFKYRQKISDAYANSQSHITVLFEDILNFRPTLANYLLNFPEQALEEATESFKNIYRIDAGGMFDPNLPYTVRIGTNNNSNEVPLRQIRSSHIDKLLYVRGIIIRSSIVRPQIVKASFQCQVCGTVMEIDQNSTNLIPPRECENDTCKNKKDFKVITEDSEFIDYQSITIQEAPEDLRSGDIPQTLFCVLLSGLVDAVRPGERVKIMGILKSIPKEDRRGRLSTLFTTHLMVNNIEGVKQDEEDQDLTNEDIEEIISLSQEPLIQNKIARSIARAILGHDHLKMAAAMSLFGGNQKIKKDGSKLRGDIHVLFMGDPGTGKSQILQNCAQIAPRSVYTSGKGASAAGLCVVGSSRLFFKNTTSPIRDVVNFHFQNEKIYQYNETMRYVKDNLNPHQTLHSNNLKVEPHSISRVWKINSPPTLIRLKTEIGRSMELTPQTPLLSLDVNHGLVWKPAHLLEKHDVIAISQHLPCDKVIAIPTIKEIFEGYSSNLPKLHPEVLEELNSDWFTFIGQCFGVIGTSACIETIKHHNNLSQNPHLFKSLYSKYYTMEDGFDLVFPILNSFGITRSFEIGEEIFKWDILYYKKDILSAFLRGLFDAHSKMELDFNNPYLTFTTKSTILADFVVYAMQRYGIVIYKEHNLGKHRTSDFADPSEDIHGIFYLSIRGLSDIQKFAENIGFSEPIKTHKLKRITRSHPLQTSKSDIIPEIAPLVLKIRDFYNSISKVNIIPPIEILTNGGISKQSLLKFIDNLHSSCEKFPLQLPKEMKKQQQLYSEKLAFLNHLAHSDLVWDHIETVEEFQATDEFVYDLTVPETHNFLVNGIVTHNTAAVIREGDNTGMQLEAGALVLASGGIAAIDEFDKMRKQDRSAIHEAMEQQTISIAKAGIVATLQAKTAIIAAANPKQGRWNDYETAAANINLSPPILSRFDLIFVVRDIPEKNTDDRIADYILKNHMQGFDETYSEDDEQSNKTPKKEDFIPMELLKRYITYARNNYHPKLTKEAAEKIKNFYIEMRTSNTENSTAVSIVARNLDGMVRLCEAYAKMALREFVTIEDAQEVIKLEKRSLHDIGYDEETGDIDMDRVLTGQSANKRKKLNLILDKIKEMLLDSPSEPLHLDDIIENLAGNSGITKDFIKTALDAWQKDGTLYCPRNGEYRIPGLHKK